MTLKNHSLKATPKPADLINEAVELMSEGELLAIYSKVALKLNVDVSKINLADELGLQYRSAMILLDKVQNDDSIPANQRSQVFNTARSMLSQIIKEQGIVYGAERLKRYESAWLKAAMKLPNEEMRRAFFDLYGEYMKDPNE